MVLIAPRTICRTWPAFQRRTPVDSPWHDRAASQTGRGQVLRGFHFQGQTPPPAVITFSSFSFPAFSWPGSLWCPHIARNRVHAVHFPFAQLTSRFAKHHSYSDTVSDYQQFIRWWRILDFPSLHELRSEYSEPLDVARAPLTTFVVYALYMEESRHNATNAHTYDTVSPVT